MRKIEMIYNLREKLKINSDDSATSDEYLSHLLDLKRVKIIQQRIDKTPWRAPIELKQELKMELETVNSVNGISCFGKILRTKIALPNMIRAKGGDLGITVRRGDKMSLLIDIVSLDRLPFVGNGMFINQIIYASFDYDNRLYLVSNQKKHLLLGEVLVGGIYEDVILAGDLDSQTNLDLDDWEREYPLTLDLVDIIIELVYNDLKKSMNIEEDKVNDAD